MSDCFTGRLKEHVPLSIEAFGKVLAEKPNLRMIDFSDNAFSPAGATALSYFLANCTSLEELRLNNNGLGPEGGKIIANGLKENRRKSQANGKPSSLLKVTIGRNRLENGSATELSEAFSLHENLEDVALFQNGIRPEGIVALSQGLSKCLKLKSLDLQDNTFTSKGSVAFAAAIPSWTELARLNIGDCLLSDSGCKEIIEKLVQCPSASKLTFLNFQYAEMEPETAAFFAANLKSFPSLEKLYLNGNCFAPEGPEVQSIKSALSPTTTLDELDDMEYEEEFKESESEGEGEVEEIVAVDQIASPKPALDEIKHVTENIGAMSLKEPEEMVPEAIEAEAAKEDVLTEIGTTDDVAEISSEVNVEKAEVNDDTAEVVSDTKEVAAEAEVVDSTEAESENSSPEFVKDGTEPIVDTSESVSVEGVAETITEAETETSEAVKEAAEFAKTNEAEVEEPIEKATETTEEVTETTEEATETTEEVSETTEEATETTEEATETGEEGNKTTSEVTETTEEVTKTTEEPAETTEEAIAGQTAEIESETTNENENSDN